MFRFEVNEYIYRVDSRVLSNSHWYGFQGFCECRNGELFSASDLDRVFSQPLGQLYFRRASPNAYLAVFHCVSNNAYPLMEVPFGLLDNPLCAPSPHPPPSLHTLPSP